MYYVKGIVSWYERLECAARMLTYASTANRGPETCVAFVSLWPCVRIDGGVNSVELDWFAHVIIGNASVTKNLIQWPSLVFDVASFNLHFNGFSISPTGFSFSTILAREDEMMSQERLHRQERTYEEPSRPEHWYEIAIFVELFRVVCSTWKWMKLWYLTAVKSTYLWGFAYPFTGAETLHYSIEKLPLLSKPSHYALPVPTLIRHDTRRNCLLIICNCSRLEAMRVEVVSRIAEWSCADEFIDNQDISESRYRELQLPSIIQVDSAESSMLKHQQWHTFAVVLLPICLRYWKKKSMC